RRSHSGCAYRLHRSPPHAHALDPVVRRLYGAHRGLPGLLVPTGLPVSHGTRPWRRMGAVYYLGALGLSWLFFLRVNDWYALLATAAANGFFTGGQFSWMTIYLPELFPTRVRGSAISLVFDGSRTVAALGPLLAGWLASSFGGIGTAAAMMSLIYVVGLIVTPFAGPETKGKELRA